MLNSTPGSLHIRLLLCLTIFSFQLVAQNINVAQEDSLIFSQRAVSIHGKQYNGFLTRNGFQLLSVNQQAFFNAPGDYFDWQVKDFNKDGFKDIYLNKGGNTPERFDLFLYLPKTKTFRQVVDFENFPATENIPGTKYFYSYHRSGCADMNWDSDLFYIKDFKAVRIANISGRECENSVEKDGLYVNKVRGVEKRLFKTLPIDTVHKFKNDKWGFIKKYWSENYKIFL